MFRLGSTANLDANFRHDQIWVNSQPRNWRQSAGADRISQCRSTLTNSDEHSNSPPTSGYRVDNVQRSYGSDTLDHHTQPESGPGAHVPLDIHSQSDGWIATHSHSPFSDAACSVRSTHDNAPEGQDRRPTNPNQDSQPLGDNYQIIRSNLSQLNQTSTTSSLVSDTQASRQLQESCLMRYFIEELSPWVRICNTSTLSLGLTNLV